MVAFVASVHADDRPSWAIIDAADRLIAKNALFMPGGDGFLKQPSGLLVQYEQPSKSYSRNGKNWMIEIQSRRWREEAAKEWQPWNDARPQYDHWRVGVIRVDVLISGVEASWVDNQNFSGRTPPSQSEVMHRLNTLGQASVRTPDNQASRTKQDPVSEIHPHTIRSEQSSHGGIFRKLPDGTLQKVSPPQNPRFPIPDSVQSIPSPRPRVVPPPRQSPPQVQITPDPTPPLPTMVARLSLPAPSFGWVILPIAAAITVVVAMGFFILRTRRETTIPYGVSSSHATTPLTSPSTSPPPQETIQSASQPNLLMSPAESSFFNALQQAVGPSCTVAAKIRAANLFGDDSVPEKDPSRASFCGTLIDFVIYNPSKSRILCAIELDENSQAHPDRLKRDSSLTKLFQSKQVPLVRIPISWTYYPQGIRTELLKAGIVL